VVGGGLQRERSESFFEGELQRVSLALFLTSPPSKKKSHNLFRNSQGVGKCNMAANTMFCCCIRQRRTPIHPQVVVTLSQRTRRSSPRARRASCAIETALWRLRVRQSLRSRLLFRKTLEAGLVASVGEKGKWSALDGKRQQLLSGRGEDKAFFPFIFCAINFEDCLCLPKLFYSWNMLDL
jgi:hypothetical protein